MSITDIPRPLPASSIHVENNYLIPPGPDFEAFPKIARLNREVIVTEKIDGTNAQVALFEINNDLEMAQHNANPFCLGIGAPAELGSSPLAIYAGSRKRWIHPNGWNGNKGADNFGFAQWVYENMTELVKLGPGRHYGEWYGAGIQRGYGLDVKRFALFNVNRWADRYVRPRCCQVVPTLDVIPEGDLMGTVVDDIMEELRMEGSCLVPDYDDPEGIVLYHTASRTLFKRTFENDGGKWR